MKKIFKRIIGITLVVLFITTQTSLAAVSEKTSDNFKVIPIHPNAINPVNLIYELKPGDKLEDELYVQNFAVEDKDFELYVTDRFIASSGLDAFKNSDEDRKMAKLATLDTDKIVVKGDEKEKIKLSISIPPDQAEGDYAGGVAVVNTRPSKDNDLLKIAVRYVVMLDIKVTNNPKHIPLLGETNIFGPQNYYFPFSVAVFVGGMGYFILEKIKENKRKKTAPVDRQKG